MNANAGTFVGVDAHKTSLHVAMLVPGQRVPVTWQVANGPAAVRRLARRLQREAPGHLECCCEAGPLGYSLQRQLGALGVSCQVVAPSLIPIRPGEHVKTDRRDARKLAELLAVGTLTEVHPPSAAHEALRNLSRGREDIRLALTRAKHRIDKFLLRHGIVYTVSKRPWGKPYRAWLRRLNFEHAADQACFDAYLVTHEQLGEHAQSGPREPGGGRRSGHARADDEHVHGKVPGRTGHARSPAPIPGIASMGGGKFDGK